MHATFAAVAERISVTSGIAIESLRPDTALADLAMDSFLMVEVTVDLQEEFDAIFSQEALHKVVTIGDLVDLLNATQFQRAPRG